MFDFAHCKSFTARTPYRQVYNLLHRRRRACMNPDLEEVGTLVSAGLVAREVDAVSIPAGHDTKTHANCLNCGAALGSAYCSRCGQAAHLHRSLLHLSEEFLHGVLHFEAKGFRTVPLLFFRPGLLTRRYIEGQRTRYVSPMALFLFCIFLAYFVFSLVGAPKNSVVNVKFEDAAAAKADVDQSLAEAEANPTQASKDLEAARKSGGGGGTAERSVPSGSAFLPAQEYGLQVLVHAHPDIAAVFVADVRLAARGAGVRPRDLFTLFALVHEPALHVARADQ